MRRKRSPHPGIVVRPGRPHKNEHPYIRFKDPDTGKMKTEPIPPDLGPVKPRPSPELKKWLKRRSVSLQSRRLSSTPPESRVLIVDAIEIYFEQTRNAKSSIGTYRCASRLLAAWAGEKKHTDDLTLAELFKLRTVLSPRHLKAVTWNSRIKHVKAIINYWRKTGLTPRLASEEVVNQGLALHSEPKNAPRFLRRAEMASGFNDLTPDERVFVLVTLLTGMRLGEALHLEWGQVDFETNEIRLDARTKTRKWRIIDLNVCPSVVEMLKARGVGKLKERIFPMSNRQIKNLRKKLPCMIKELRKTCSTYLVNAPGIYGAQSLRQAAMQLGHDYDVADKTYAGQLRHIPVEHKTLEAAMGLPIPAKADAAE